MTQWETIATQRGRVKRAAACRLQRALRDHPHDWPAVLDDFAAYRQTAAAPAVADELFSQWRERAVVACRHYEERDLEPKKTWAYWLIEARRDPAKQRTQFVEYLGAWLDACQSSAALFRKHWRSLALLTLGLPRSDKLAEQCPTFRGHVVMSATRIEPQLLASLTEAFVFLGDSAANLDPLPVWHQHLHELVPDPGGMSHYREPAMWMKALSETHPGRYAVVLALWKTTFKRIASPIINDLSPTCHATTPCRRPALRCDCGTE